MSEQVDKKLAAKWQELRKAWSDKLGLKPEVLDEELKGLHDEEKELHKEWDATKKFKNAMRRLYIRYKKKLASPAVSFNFFVIGPDRLINTVSKRRTEAFSKWQKEGDMAVFTEANPDGVVKIIYRADYEAEGKLDKYDELKKLGSIQTAPSPDGNGSIEFCVIPVDNRKTFKSGKENKFFGSPLALESYMRNIYGIGMHQGSTTPKPMIITLNGDLAKPIPPCWTALKARFVWKPTEAEQKDASSITVYQVSGTSATKFEVDKEAKKIDFESLIKRFAADWFSELEDLELWHDDHKEEFNRVVVTEGDVISLQLEATPQGSRRMVIDDISLGLGDEDETNRGVLVWIPPYVDIDFAEESRVLVVGRSNRGRSRDDITGEWLDEWEGDVNLGAFGVWAIPEYKVEIMAQELKEEEIFGDEETETEASGHDW